MADTIQVAVRLPADLLERVDRHAEVMGKQTPGVTFSRADAVRSLLTRALDEVGPAEKKRKGR